MIIPVFVLSFFINSFGLLAEESVNNPGNLFIGWESVDITPNRPVVITGGSSARVSEGISDPITATILLFESVSKGSPSETTVMVSTDLIGISYILEERIKDGVRRSIPEIDANKIILNATHTHTAPDQNISTDLDDMHKKLGLNVPVAWAKWGIDLGVMTAEEYVEFAGGLISEAINKAWKERKPGGISFGLSHAVVSHNRLTSYYDGHSRMGGKTDDPEFSHIEGYEDHSLNLLYTWDDKGKLTGVVINVASPSQVQYGLKLSADYWYETRLELHRRLGDDLFIFPQCSSAGDQFPGVLVYRNAETRMEKLFGRTRREQIANRIADGVTSILPVMQKNIEWDPVLKNRTEQIELEVRIIHEGDIMTRKSSEHSPEVENVEEAFERLKGEYLTLYKKFEENPELKKQPRWYSSITAAHWRLGRAWKTLERYNNQKNVPPTIPIGIHVIRIGDMAIATNPFELYLDFSIQMKTRSKAVQTFVVELSSGPGGGYLPTRRSVAGGAYGAIPQSTMIGPDGGKVLVNKTLDIIESMWNE
jgi:hypothetical protein